VCPNLIIVLICFGLKADKKYIFEAKNSRNEIKGSQILRKANESRYRPKRRKIEIVILKFRFLNLKWLDLHLFNDVKSVWKQYTEQNLIFIRLQN